MMGVDASLVLAVTSSVALAVNCDLSPIVQSVAMIVNSTHKGVAKIVEALLGGSIARLERDKILTEAQTAKDKNDVTSGEKVYQDGTLMYPQEKRNYDNIAQFLKNADTNRLLKCVLSAAEQIKSVPESEIAKGQISSTFFNRWRKEAEQIDDQKMRDWWARILVREAKRSDSISLRTLDVAKNLTHEEAKVFARVLKGMCEGAIFTNRKGSSACGTFGDIITLQDAGLVKQERTMKSFEGAVDLENPKHFLVRLEFDEVMIVCESRRLSVPCYLLTSAGCELSKIATIHQGVDDIKAICNIVKESATGARTYLQTWAEFYGQEKHKGE